MQHEYGFLPFTCVFWRSKVDLCWWGGTLLAYMHAHWLFRPMRTVPHFELF